MSSLKAKEIISYTKHLSVCLTNTSDSFARKIQTTSQLQDATIRDRAELPRVTTSTTGTTVYQRRVLQLAYGMKSQPLRTRQWQ